MIRILRDIATSLIRASSPSKAAASKLEVAASMILTVIGGIAVGVAIWRISAGDEHEFVMRAVYVTFVFVVMPVGFYLRDRSRGDFD